MPASFAPEALRAQAVAARTYILQRVRGGAANHPEAGVCDQYTCCCARKDDAALREQWGADYTRNMARIRQAVDRHGRAVSHLRRAAHPRGVPRLVRRGDREQRRALERRRAVSRERILPRDGAGRAELRLDGRDRGRRRAGTAVLRPLSGLRARRRPGHMVRHAGAR
ncbi:MAG: SpoIID/LytB domain-containing protein [Oscillospiraceae bacterium]